MYAQRHFFKCEITTITVGNFKTILKSKFDEGKVILDEIQFGVCKIIYKDIYMKVYGIWSGGLVCESVLLTIIRSAIVANAFSRDLETHKSQNFHMVVSRGIVKLSTSPEVTIFTPPVPYSFISDQCLKGDRWTTLFLRNSIVAMICKIFKLTKCELFWKEKLSKFLPAPIYF